MVKYVWDCTCKNWSWWNRVECFKCGEARPPNAKKRIKEVAAVVWGSDDEKTMPKVTKGPKAQVGKTQKQTERQKEQAKEISKLKKQLEEAQQQVKDLSTEASDDDDGSGEGADETNYANATIEDIKTAIKALEEVKFGKTPQMEALIEQHKAALLRKEKERDAAKPQWQLDRKLSDQVDKAKKKVAKGKERMAAIDDEVKCLTKEKEELKEQEVKLNEDIRANEAELARLSKQRAGLPPSLAATFNGVMPDLLEEPEVKRVEKLAISCFQAALVAARGRAEIAAQRGQAPLPAAETATIEEATLGNEILELERQMTAITKAFEEQHAGVMKMQERTMAHLAALQKTREGTVVAVQAPSTGALAAAVGDGVVPLQTSTGAAASSEGRPAVAEMRVDAGNVADISPGNQGAS